MYQYDDYDRALVRERPRPDWEASGGVEAFLGAEQAESRHQPRLLLRHLASSRQSLCGVCDRKPRSYG